MEVTAIEGKDIILLLVGAALGFVLGLVGNVIMLYFQFQRSIAAYRVNGVAKATKEIKAVNSIPEYSGYLVDRFRFSLGPIIDQFTQPCFKNTFAEGRMEGSAPFPSMVDFDPDKATSAEKICGIDRWQKFIRYVRPVMDDINDFALLSFIADMLNPFLFLEVFPQCLPLHRLHALSQLCRKIETTVGILDGAFQRDIVKLTNENHIEFVDLDLGCRDAKNKEECRTHQAELARSYQELSKAWVAWQKINRT